MSPEVTVATMVFKRHDLLSRLAASLAASETVPDRFVVVDHSYDRPKVEAAVARGGWPLAKAEIVTLADPGCAHAANWVLRNTPDGRIGCGDDIAFAPGAIGAILATEGDFVIPGSRQNAFACCSMRDSLVAKVGWFDEEISPRYLYFEDCDYVYRMKLLGIPIVTAAGAVVDHLDGGSQTFKSYTVDQLNEHHRRFAIAQENYLRKWGGMPYEEKHSEPYGGVR